MLKIARLLLLLCPLAVCAHVSAGRIDADSVSIAQAGSGYKLVEDAPLVERIFDFSPVVGHKKNYVPGFSDPMGSGTDPQLKVFGGKLENIALLGDFHPSNPYNPEEVAPSKESVEVAHLVNDLLYDNSIPGRKKLVSRQLDVTKAKTSALHEDPRTTETLPLNLSGFGSVSTISKPVQVHWTQCPDFAFKRFLYNRSNAKGAPTAVQRLRPGRDCFVI